MMNLLRLLQQYVKYNVANIFLNANKFACITEGSIYYKDCILYVHAIKRTINNDHHIIKVNNYDEYLMIFHSTMN